MPRVSDHKTASATAENEMLSPAARPLKASPGLPRRSSFLPSSTTASSISGGDFIVAMTPYVTGDPRSWDFPYYGNVVCLDAVHLSSTCYRITGAGAMSGAHELISSCRGS